MVSIAYICNILHQIDNCGEDNIAWNLMNNYTLHVPVGIYEIVPCNIRACMIYSNSLLFPQKIKFMKVKEIQFSVLSK